jgi:6-phosphogluconolactonase/glucosamine-6-phosphate isomerase/deaminase
MADPIMETDPSEHFNAPDTRYFRTKEQFDEAVGRDFIEKANQLLEKGDHFIVGLSHGQSPAGAYRYIILHFGEIKQPQKILFTFVHSLLKSQEGLENIVDAGAFVRELVRAGLISKNQVLDKKFEPEDAEAYAAWYNKKLSAILKEQGKEGLDYVFLASNPLGRVAGIERRSKAFGSTNISVPVLIQREPEVTVTPAFLQHSRHIAFLATKADKRRPLAWLYAIWGKSNESPSFLRFMDRVNKRMVVFIDDQALTWPQVEITRKTPYGDSVIRIDTAKPYNHNAKEKLPVILLIHGFLGLNSYDGLLTAIPTTKYIAAAMHYGSIPNDLPVSEYSNHVLHNIDAVVDYFGSIGHPVYIFDHSMSNIYFLMADRDIDKLKGIKNYLRGRIGANPFFGEEAKHALLGFLDSVIIPSQSGLKVSAERTLLYAFRRIVPLDSRHGVRRRGIRLSEMLINNDSVRRDRIWTLAKERILYLMTNMDSLPHINRIPIERALNKLPAKIFAIQTHSALEESKAFDRQVGLINMHKNHIPVMILKSERDGVAKYVPRLYDDGMTKVVDVTNQEEQDLFREHLYHMVHPQRTAAIIDEFIRETSTWIRKK